MIDLAGREIEQLLKKSAVGAGLYWGEAEDYAKAMINLLRYFPSSAPFIVQYINHRDIIKKCLYYLDRYHHNMRTVIQLDIPPLLLFAFLLYYAKSHQLSFYCQWNNQQGDNYHQQNTIAMAYDGHYDLHWQGGDDNLYKLSCHDFIYHDDTTKLANICTPCDRIYLSADIYHILYQFYLKTTVPANERSRLLGAGAGTSDND